MTYNEVIKDMIEWQEIRYMAWRVRRRMWLSRLIRRMF